MDFEKLADSIVGLVEKRLAAQLDPLVARLDQLEAKEVPQASAIIGEILSGDKLATLVGLEVAKAVEEIELPALPEPIPGKKGDDGKDGVGLAGALIDRDGNLVITLTNGEVKSLGQVVGKDGDPGKDGTDGVGFDDLSVSFDGESIVHEYKRGEKSIVQTFPLNVMKHIGFWREGMEAKSGNTTTHAGSLWVCLNDTSERPNYQAKDWILAARAGRDGQDKTDAKPSEPVKLHGN